MSTEIKVDKGLPIPKKGSSKGKPFKYPFQSMEIGDSFFVPFKEDTPHIDLQRSIYFSALSYAKRRNLPNKYKTRRFPDGVRIWRIQ